MRNRRNQQVAIVVKANESAIKEMISVGGQEKAVLPIQAFLVGCVSPRLAMAGPKMLWSANSRNTARVFDTHDVFFELALASSCQDDCLLFSLADRGGSA